MFLVVEHIKMKHNMRVLRVAKTELGIDIDTSRYRVFDHIYENNFKNNHFVHIRLCHIFY